MSNHTNTLPPAVSLNTVMELAAALGRQAAATFLADDAEGLTPGQRRRAEGLTIECIDEVDDLVCGIEQRAPGAGSRLVATLREAMAGHHQQHAAFVADLDAYDAGLLQVRS